MLNFPDLQSNRFHVSVFWGKARVYDAKMHFEEFGHFAEVEGVIGPLPPRASTLGIGFV